MKLENFVAGYQHTYLSECERQLSLNPTAVPYPRATLLFCLFAALNLTLVFALVHFVFKLPITSASTAFELTTIGLVVVAHVVLLPNRKRLGSNYMAYEAAEVERFKTTRDVYSLVSSFVPFALLWMLVPRAL